MVGSNVKGSSATPRQSAPRECDQLAKYCKLDARCMMMGLSYFNCSFAYINGVTTLAICEHVCRAVRAVSARGGSEVGVDRSFVNLLCDNALRYDEL